MSRTPIKLKRDFTSISTIDRTIPIRSKQPSATLSTVCPSFAPAHRPPLQKHSSSNTPPALIDSIKIDTASFEKQVRRIIEEEKNLSQRDRTNSKGGHFYLPHPVQDRVVMGELWSIPERVSRLYEELAVGEEKADFKQGVLAKASIYYFAVANKVLFYDLGSAIKLGGRLEDFFMQESQFDCSIYEMKQINWKHPIFGEFKNRNIVLLSCPWKFQFAALEYQSGLLLGSKSPRWMRITILRTTFSIETQIASHITEAIHSIYYLDARGGLNKVSVTDNNWIGKILKDSSRYRLTQTSKTFEIQSLYLNRRATFLEKLRHYCKVIYSKTFQFYGNVVRNYDLIYDAKRQRLYSLIDSNASPSNREMSNYKMLVCWDDSKGSLIKKCEISELQLYEKEMGIVANYSNIGNYRIAKLYVIDKGYDLEANLVIVLQCGIRLYMMVEETFQLVKYHYPPKIQDKQAKRTEARESEKSVEVTHSLQYGSTTILNLKEENENHTILIWRINQLRQCENCIELTWGRNMVRGPVGNSPVQNYLSRVNIDLGNSKKQQILKGISLASIQNLHELARHIFLPPELFLHSTDLELEYFYVIRSVDKMFNALLSEVKDHHIFRKIFEDYSVDDMMYLLVQIYCDPEGLYVRNTNLIDSMTQFQKKVMQQGGDRFQSFQFLFNQMTRRDYLNQNNIRQIKPSLVGRQSLLPQTYQNILQHLLELSKIRKAESQSPNQISDSICNSILVYLGRLLRFVWDRSLSDFNKNIESIIPFIQPLDNIIKYFSSQMNANIKNNQQRKYTLDRLIENRKYSQPSQSQIDRNSQQLKQISQYINKIIQLIVLSTRVNLKIDMSFQESLSLNSEYFQQHIFNYIIDKYQNSFNILELFRQHFPSFISSNLEKALKIYDEAKTKSESQIIKIVRFHKKIPHYLLKYFENSGLIHSEQIKEIIKIGQLPSSQNMVVNYDNLKQNIQSSLEYLLEPHHTLDDRNISILRINSLLDNYLVKNRQKEDRFYLQKKSQLSEIKKKIIFQQIIIEEYLRKNQHVNPQILTQLKTTLYTIQEIYQFQKSLKSDSLSIIFSIMAQTYEDQNIKESFLRMLKRNKQNYPSDRSILKKAVSCMKIKLKGQQQLKRWFHIQQSLNLITSKTKDLIKVDKFIELISHGFLLDSKEKEDLQGQIAKLAQIASQYRDKEGIEAKAQEIKFPIVSLIVWKAGLDQREMKEYYQNFLRKYGKSSQPKQQQWEQKFILYTFLNMICFYLVVEPRWESFLYNAKNFVENYKKKGKQETSKHISTLCQKIAQLAGRDGLYNNIFGEK